MGEGRALSGGSGDIWSSMYAETLSTLCDLKLFVDTFFLSRMWTPSIIVRGAAIST